jgi:hypothetical protein
LIYSIDWIINICHFVSLMPDYELLKLYKNKSNTFYK